MLNTSAAYFLYSYNIYWKMLDTINYINGSVSLM